MNITTGLASLRNQSLQARRSQETNATDAAQNAQKASVQRAQEMAQPAMESVERTPASIEAQQGARQGAVQRDMDIRARLENAVFRPGLDAASLIETAGSGRPISVITKPKSTKA